MAVQVGDPLSRFKEFMEVESPSTALLPPLQPTDFFVKLPVNDPAAERALQLREKVARYWQAKTTRQTQEEQQALQNRQKMNF